MHKADERLGFWLEHSSSRVSRNNWPTSELLYNCQNSPFRTGIVFQEAYYYKVLHYRNWIRCYATPSRRTQSCLRCKHWAQVQTWWHIDTLNFEWCFVETVSFQCISGYRRLRQQDRFGKRRSYRRQTGASGEVIFSIGVCKTKWRELPLSSLHLTPSVLVVDGIHLLKIRNLSSISFSLFHLQSFPHKVLQPKQFWKQDAT